MTEPTTGAHDPMTQMLVMLTEIRGDVRTALAVQQRHDGQLSEHETKIAGLDTRVTVIETRQTADESHESNRLSHSQVFWGAVGAVAMVAAVLVSYFLTAKHGG